MQYAALYEKLVPVSPELVLFGLGEAHSFAGGQGKLLPLPLRLEDQGMESMLDQGWTAQVHIVGVGVGDIIEGKQGFSGEKIAVSPYVLVKAPHVARTGHCNGLYVDIGPLKLRD